MAAELSLQNIKQLVSEFEEIVNGLSLNPYSETAKRTAEGINVLQVKEIILQMQMIFGFLIAKRAELAKLIEEYKIDQARSESSNENIEEVVNAVSADKSVGVAELIANLRKQLEELDKHIDALGDMLKQLQAQQVQLQNQQASLQQQIQAQQALLQQTQFAIAQAIPAQIAITPANVSTAPVNNPTTQVSTVATVTPVVQPQVQVVNNQVQVASDRQPEQQGLAQQHNDGQRMYELLMQKINENIYKQEKLAEKIVMYSVLFDSSNKIKAGITSDLVALAQHGCASVVNWTPKSPYDLCYGLQALFQKSGTAFYVRNGKQQDEQYDNVFSPSNKKF